MEMRDVIHGSILIHPTEIPILNSPYFQRLRQIKQLGFAENSFPSATHNRFIHSLGAMKTATQALRTIFQKHPHPVLSPAKLSSFRAVVRLASLLHDIGHGPLSHATEFAMPEVRKLQLPHLREGQSTSRKATHEDYTLKMILDSPLTPLIQKAGKKHGFQPLHVAGLIQPQLEVLDDFFMENIRESFSHSSQTVDFRPLLQQLISSELDADRMDYLRRDSLYTGVSYGQFDFDWLVGNLTYHIQKNQCYLALQHRALYTFEDFLLSRFHMFLMVYFHHKSVIFDEMLGQYFLESEDQYSLPADIEKYCQLDDAHLTAHLAQSSNPWARRIIEKKPYRMLIELHSGIPATQTANLEHQVLLTEIQKNLTHQKMHYLSITSTSELSKYFRRPGNPIFVRYDNHYSDPSFIPLEQCTDLFQKYSEKRTITRLYVSPENYPFCKNLGRTSSLR